MKMRVLALLVIALVSISASAQIRLVMGTVTDSSGKPLNGAKVDLVSAQHPNDGKSNKTDSKGRFSFRGFKPGDITLTITMDGYVERKVEFRTSESGTDRKDVVLYREGETDVDNAVMVPVTGHIYGKSGNPLAGVKVTATVEGTPYEAETTTDESGQYTINGPTGNELVIHGSLEEYRDQILRVKIRGDRPIELKDPKEFVMLTLDEAYEAIGQERPKDEPPTPEEEAIELYNLAVEPYQQGNYDQAESFALKALEKHPDQEASLKLLIHSNYKSQDWKDALMYSEKFLKLHPNDTNVMKIAQQAAAMTNNKDVAKKFKNQLKDAGEIDKDSLWSDAVAALNDNDDDTAVKIINEILEMDPKDPRAFFELGKVKVREGDFEAAVKNLKTYMKYAKTDDPFRQEAKDLILTLSE